MIAPLKWRSKAEWVSGIPEVTDKVFRAIQVKAPHSASSQATFLVMDRTSGPFGIGDDVGIKCLESCEGLAAVFITS